MMHGMIMIIKRSEILRKWFLEHYSCVALFNLISFGLRLVKAKGPVERIEIKNKEN